jgi:hypothetical protein
VQIVKPATVVAWHRRLFAWQWRWRSAPPRLGRPPIAGDVRALIQKMHRANPFWGAPHIHGELQKLGIDIAETTVAKYLGRRPSSPSPTWRTFLRTHLSQCASMDFFTVPTATFRILFVLVIHSHERRRIVRLNVTDHPTAAWTRQQVRDAFPDQTAPKYLLRDRDSSYGPDFGRLLQSFGTEELVIAPRAPWQNPYAERLTGTLRRECLDHVIVWNERSLRRTLRCFLDYYHEWVLISHWTRMRPSGGLHNRQPAARSSKCPTSAGCNTTTNVALPDHRSSAGQTRRRCASSDRPYAAVVQIDNSVAFPKSGVACRRSGDPPNRSSEAPHRCRWSFL